MYGVFLKSLLADIKELLMQNKKSFIPKVLRSEDLLQAIFFSTECIAIFYHFLCSVNHLFFVICLNYICSAMRFIVLADISTDYDYGKVVHDFHEKGFGPKFLAKRNLIIDFFS